MAFQKMMRIKKIFRKRSITGDTDISEEYKAGIVDNFRSKDEGSKTFARNFQASKDYTCFLLFKWAFIIVDGS